VNCSGARSSAPPSRTRGARSPEMGPSLQRHDDQIQGDRDAWYRGQDQHLTPHASHGSPDKGPHRQPAANIDDPRTERDA
jgi:hypothetical protein